MNKSGYGWIICAASALLIFCTGGLGVTGFSVFQPYLIEFGGINYTQSSTIVLFRTLCTLIGMLSANTLIKKFEIRRVATVALLLCAASFLLFGLSTSFMMYCISASIMGLVVGFGGLITASVLIARWFNEHRGFAVGISMAATGLSAVVAAPVITHLVEKYSLETAFYLTAAAVACAAIIFYALVHSRPECIDAEPIGAESSQSAGTYAPQNATRSIFWAMFIGVLIFGMPGNAFASHISLIFNNVGFSSKDVSATIAIFGVTLAIGKCAYGFIADKIGTYYASWILYALALIGIGTCYFVRFPQRYMAYFSVVCMGLGLAVTSVSTSMYATAISTEETYAKNLSSLQIASNLGALIFGTVPGIIADRTGNYTIAIGIMFFLALGSAIFLQKIFKIVEQRNNACLS